MISGHGLENSAIMLVGDYGSLEDLKNEKALTESTETLLTSLFAHSGLQFRYTYRTLYIKDHVEQAKNKRQRGLNIENAFTKASSLGINYDEILINEIITYKPTVIVPLGDLSLKFLTWYQPISSYRGSILPLRPSIQEKIPDKIIRVIPTLSPTHIFADYKSRYYVTLDINKIVRNMDSKGPIEVKESVWVCRSVEAFRNFLARMREKNPPYMTFDIETFCGFPTCISFCFDGLEACSVPIIDREVRMDYANQFLLFVDILHLLNSKLPKGNQNVEYDWTILERFGLRVENICFDTVLGFSLLYPEFPKNLGFQTSIYTDLSYFKDESNSKESAFNPKTYTRDTLYLYNAKDALATWQIHKKQIEEMKEIGVYELYTNKLVPLIYLYKAIDDIGVRIDTSKRNQLVAKYRTLFDLNYSLLRNKIGQDINISSHQQLGTLIYEVLKYPSRTKINNSGGKSYKTDKDTLDELLILHGDKNSAGEDGKTILKLITVCKKLSKVIEYLMTPLYPGDILKTSYNLAGTETGRTSASKTIDTLYYYNSKDKLEEVRMGRSLQTITKNGFEIDGEIFDSFEDKNVGKDIRAMFIPRPGKIFIEWDKSQAESRVVAVLADDYEMLESHDKKPKIHAKTAAAIFGIDASTISKEFPKVPITGMPYYDMGKRARHAFHYKMQAPTLSAKTHLPVHECAEILKKISLFNPKIETVFHAEITRILKHTQCLVTPFLRRRDFFDRYSDAMIREGLAQIPQSTVSDDLKFGMLEVSKKAPWATFLIEQHDSCLTEVDTDKGDEFIEIVRNETQSPIDFSKCSISRDFRLTIPIEISKGFSWFDMEEVSL